MQIHFRFSYSKYGVNGSQFRELSNTLIIALGLWREIIKNVQYLSLNTSLPSNFRLVSLWKAFLNARKSSVGGSIFFCKLFSPVALNLNFHSEQGKKYHGINFSHDVYSLF